MHNHSFIWNYERNARNFFFMSVHVRNSSGLSARWTRNIKSGFQSNDHFPETEIPCSEFKKPAISKYFFSIHYLIFNPNLTQLQYLGFCNIFWLVPTLIGPSITNSPILSMTYISHVKILLDQSSRLEKYLDVT